MSSLLIRVPVIGSGSGRDLPVSTVALFHTSLVAPHSLCGKTFASILKVDRKDAIFSIGRIAWLVLALQSGNVNNLRAGCEDKMHQPQRARQDAYKHVRALWVILRQHGCAT